MPTKRAPFDRRVDFYVLYYDYPFYLPIELDLPARLVTGHTIHHRSTITGVPTATYLTTTYGIVPPQPVPFAASTTVEVILPYVIAIFDHDTSEYLGVIQDLEWAGTDETVEYFRYWLDTTPID